MKIYQNDLYMDDVKAVCCLDLPWEKLEGKSMLVSGSTGMIGSCLIDVVMQKNRTDGLNCKVYALGRDAEKAKIRFGYCKDCPEFEFIAHDINRPFGHDLRESSFVLHLASNTHPVQYSTDPIGTVTTNIIGTNNLLEFAARHNAERFLFASSVEVYGENRGDVEKFDESYLGYIDCNTLRAGYPESKRCGEALCQAYRKQYGLDIVIPRFSRIYGPTMLTGDTKASSQFIRNAAAGEDIVLKSEGNQFYSYTYVTDAVSGLLTVLLKGKCGEVYNIADEGSDITLKELARLCAEAAGTKVVFDLPDEEESRGYSKTTTARLETKRIRDLSWKAKTDIKSGLAKTIDILKWEAL